MSKKEGTLFLGRQPIVDRQSQLVGYELLYRNLEGTSEMENEHKATAHVLIHTLNLTGINTIIGDKLAFVNIDEGFLQHNMILSVPKEQFIFELDESIAKDKNLERLEELYLKGYSFAFCINEITDASFQAAKTVSKYITYIKLNTIQVDKEKLMKMLLLLGSSNKRLIASHIETADLFDTFSQMGFELFQGYFFAKPEIIESTQIGTDAPSVIALCNLLSTEASIEEITQAFMQLPTIIAQLIQYLNSCAFSLSGKIDSIERVITLLGRKALAQWLFLTLYASSSEGNDNGALLSTITGRTQLMVDILKAIKPKAKKEELAQASFMGLLSGIDAIFHQPLPEILERLNIDDQIKEALLDQKGLLGDIYEVSLSIEAFDLNKVEDFIHKHDIAPARFQKLLFRSFNSANDFKPAT